MIAGIPKAESSLLQISLVASNFESLKYQNLAIARHPLV